MSIPFSDRTYDPRVWVRVLFGFALATALGALVASYPVAVLGAAGACLALYGIFRWCHERLEFWQVLVLFALTPYLILNYGFDNLAAGRGAMGDESPCHPGPAALDVLCFRAEPALQLDVFLG